MEFHFKYAFTESEFADYNVYTSWTAPWQKKTRLKILVRQLILSAITISIVFIISPFESRSIAFYIIFSTLILALITGLTLYQVPNRIRSLAKKMIRKEENAHLLFENEMLINEEGIVNTDEMSINRYNWSSIVRYAATSDSLYLYINSMQAFILPKRVFRDQKEIQEFDQFVSRKIPLASSFRSP